MKITYVLNKEHNGIEVKFNEKPERAVLDELKAKGFRWHGGKGIWFTKQSDEVIAYVKKLANDDIKVAEKSAPTTKKTTEVAKSSTDKKKAPSAPPQKAKTANKKTEPKKKAETPKKSNIVEFPKARPEVKVAITEGQATYEDCKEKLEKERKVFCDSDSQFVIDGILEMCKVNPNFCNNVMRESKTYSGAFSYFVSLARQGYAMKCNGVTYLDNNLALGFAMDYFNMVDEDINPKGTTATMKAEEEEPEDEELSEEE